MHLSHRTILSTIPGMLALGLFTLGARQDPALTTRVTATEFRLVNAKGEALAVLGTRADGKPELRFLDGVDTRIRLGLEDHGEWGVWSGLEYRDGGNKVAAFTNNEYGSASLAFFSTMQASRGTVTGGIVTDKYGQAPKLTCSTRTLAETVFQVKLDTVVANLREGAGLAAAEWRSTVNLRPENAGWSWYEWAGGRLGRLKWDEADGLPKVPMVLPSETRGRYRIGNKLANVTVSARPTGYVVEVVPYKALRPGKAKPPFGIANPVWGDPEKLTRDEVRDVLNRAIFDLNADEAAVARGGNFVLHWRYL